MKNPLVEEWLQKAHSDWVILNRLWQDPAPEIADGVCFHAQQCIEKLFKAAIQASEGKVPKIHDLVALNELLREQWPDWSSDLDDLRFLTKAAVDFRYPGDFAKMEDAQEAFSLCQTLREKLLKQIQDSDQRRNLADIPPCHGEK